MLVWGGSPVTPRSLPAEVFALNQDGGKRRGLACAVLPAPFAALGRLLSQPAAGLRWQKGVWPWGGLRPVKGREGALS